MPFKVLFRVWLGVRRAMFVAQKGAARVLLRLRWKASGA